MKCPVCGQDIRLRDLDGQQVLAAHFRPHFAPPCPGSNKPVPEEFTRRPPATLFDT